MFQAVVARPHSTYPPNSLARDRNACDRHRLGFKPEHDQLLRVADEAAHGIGQFHEFGIGEMLAQSRLELVIGLGATCQQCVGPRKRSLVLIG
jgi:hypothetical protein